MCWNHAGRANLIKHLCGIELSGPDYDPEYRPGDSKWAASVLAISPNDGKIKWYTSQDPYDYGEISEHPLINAKINGEDRKLVVHAARNGLYYSLDRINGGTEAALRPLDRGLQLHRDCRADGFRRPGRHCEAATAFTGGSTKTLERRYGSLKAIDPITGETKLNKRLEYPNYAGAPATAGDLVFLGHYDGTFSAYDARTLEEVWSSTSAAASTRPQSATRSTASSTLRCWSARPCACRCWGTRQNCANNSTASMLFVFAL